ncbi:MAG TPA: hypothetical protein VKQ30_01565 [Ktedonobacterales bacterium]|nr:hypothetical protein [Ktedonobacterales bacterium]
MTNDPNDISGMPELSPNWQAVPEGAPVITMDGQQLGTVKERREDGLLVGGNGPSEPDYLVTAQDVSRIDPDGVHLLVNESQAMRAHWQGTSPYDEQAPGGMAPGAMTRENPQP